MVRATYKVCMKTHNTMSLPQNHTHLKLIFLALFAVLCHTGQAQAIALAVPQERITMMEYVLKERPVLAGLVTKAGLTPLLSADAPVTLLAPPESSLKSIEQESPERLRSILLAHILSGTYQEKDLKDGATLKSVGNTTITVCRKKDYTLVNGVRIRQANHQVRNGLLHELDGMFRI